MGASKNDMLEREMSEALRTAKEISPDYEEQDIMEDERGLYVMVQEESDHSDVYQVEFKKRYL